MSIFQKVNIKRNFKKKKKPNYSICEKVRPIPSVQKCDATLKYKLNVYILFLKLLVPFLICHRFINCSHFIWLYLRSTYIEHPVLLMSIMQVNWVKCILLLTKTRLQVAKMYFHSFLTLYLLRDQKPDHQRCYKPTQHWPHVWWEHTVTLRSCSCYTYLDSSFLSSISVSFQSISTLTT